MGSPDRRHARRHPPAARHAAGALRPARPTCSWPASSAAPSMNFFEGTVSPTARRDPRVRRTGSKLKVPGSLRRRSRRRSAATSSSGSAPRTSTTRRAAGRAGPPAGQGDRRGRRAARLRAVRLPRSGTRSSRAGCRSRAIDPRWQQRRRRLRHREAARLRQADGDGAGLTPRSRSDLKKPRRHVGRLSVACDFSGPLTGAGSGGSLTVAGLMLGSVTDARRLAPGPPGRRTGTSSSAASSAARSGRRSASGASGTRGRR